MKRILLFLLVVFFTLPVFSQFKTTKIQITQRMVFSGTDYIISGNNRLGFFGFLSAGNQLLNAGIGDNQVTANKLDVTTFNGNQFSYNSDLIPFWELATGGVTTTEIANATLLFEDASDEFKKNVASLDIVEVTFYPQDFQYIGSSAAIIDTFPDIGQGMLAVAFPHNADKSINFNISIADKTTYIGNYLRFVIYGFHNAVGAGALDFFYFDIKCTDWPNEGDDLTRSTEWTSGNIIFNQLFPPDTLNLHTDTFNPGWAQPPGRTLLNFSMTRDVDKVFAPGESISDTIWITAIKAFYPTALQ